MARREVGALTRALQRCLARRGATLELKTEVGTRRLAQVLLGGVVETVGLEAAGGASVFSEWAGREAARTAHPSDMRTCALSRKRTGVAMGFLGWEGVAKVVSGMSFRGHVVSLGKCRFARECRFAWGVQCQRLLTAAK